MWYKLQIKKEVLLLYPQLKNKSDNLSYTTVLPRTHEEFKEAFKQLEKNQNKVPILLFFEKGEKNINTS